MRLCDLTLGSGAVLLLLVAGFPVVAALWASAFPRSPLALLAAGRTDFFMLSSVMATHLQCHLWTEDAGDEEFSPQTLNTERELPAAVHVAASQTMICVKKKGAVRLQ